MYYNICEIKNAMGNFWLAVYVHMCATLLSSYPRTLSFSQDLNLPPAIPYTIAAVGEIECKRSVPIHIKASEIHPLIQAYVGIHVGTRHQKLTAYVLCPRPRYSSCFSLFILFLCPDTWPVLRARKISHPSCQKH